jgi:hypothetical protein
LQVRTMNEDDEHDWEAVRERAHQIFLGEGSPPGRDEEHWEMATRECKWVRDRAYYIYVEEGRPSGRAAVHWRMAEDEFNHRVETRAYRLWLEEGKQPNKSKEYYRRAANLVVAGTEEPGTTVAPSQPAEPAATPATKPATR